MFLTHSHNASPRLVHFTCVRSKGTSSDASTASDVVHTPRLWNFVRSCRTLCCSRLVAANDDAICMWTPRYVWMSTVCLDASCSECWETIFIAYFSTMSNIWRLWCSYWRSVDDWWNQINLCGLFDFLCLGILYWITQQGRKCLYGCVQHSFVSDYLEVFVHGLVSLGCVLCYWGWNYGNSVAKLIRLIIQLFSVWSTILHSTALDFMRKSLDW